jgi:hypothetical protein
MGRNEIKRREKKGYSDVILFSFPYVHGSLYYPLVEQLPLPLLSCEMYE